MGSNPHRLKTGVTAGITKGWSGFVWMLQIIIPISFFTSLLSYSGWMDSIDFMLQPLMTLLNLPSMAALPILVGILTGIYGGIASMVVLPLTGDQMTLVAVFLLIAHNLVQEGIVQAKSGIHPLKATLFRLIAAVITVIIVGRFLKPDTPAVMSQGISMAVTQPFMAMLKNWFVASFYLCLKMFVVIMALMILLGIMKSYSLIHHIARVIRPVLTAIGLNQKVGILWITAAVFGIAYGAAVIVEEAKEGHFNREELEKLHISIGINHAMVEDPTLFLALGLNAFWLWVPRLMAAILAVHLYAWWHRIKSR
ncbi:MAG: nucleoside recognition domain-containing protein [Thermodesulfobacteriota bacterium]|nr:nucleoside recognition domain-containing protein [Thermodesulfobacteriota bacterium]